LFLAVTIFRDDFDSWVTFYFVILFTLKSFHWLLKDRLDYVRFRSPTIFCLDFFVIDGTNAAVAKEFSSSHSLGVCPAIIM
jgi:hypothetical protein